MARPKRNIDNETVKKAEEELKRIKDGKLSIQLKAIIAAKENPIEKVAEILNTSRSTIFRWISNFKKKGITGLKDRPKGHMKSKIEKRHKEQLEAWIMNGKNSKGQNVNWTLVKLQGEIYNEFGISIGITPLWKHLRKMNLVVKKPRPVHVKADKQKQDNFKKNSRKG